MQMHHTIVTSQPITCKEKNISASGLNNRRFNLTNPSAHCDRHANDQYQKQQKKTYVPDILHTPRREAPTSLEKETSLEPTRATLKKRGVTNNHSS